MASGGSGAPAGDTRHEPAARRTHEDPERAASVSALDELVLARAEALPLRRRASSAPSRRTSAPRPVRFALAFPDTYEVGMSNLGLPAPLPRCSTTGRRSPASGSSCPGPTWRGCSASAGCRSSRSSRARPVARLRRARGDAPVRALPTRAPSRCSTSPASRSSRASAATRTRSWWAAAPAPSTRSRWRTSSTASPSARARRSRSRSPTRSRRAASAAAAPRAAELLERLARDPRRLRAVLLRAALRPRDPGARRRSSRSAPATRRSSAASCPT